MTATAPIGIDVDCRDCDARIVLVQIIPEVVSAGTRRRRIPLEPLFDPDDPPVLDGRPVPASHALTAGRRQCRPLTRDDEPGPGEYPALTHFAVCPVRVAARSRRRREATAS